MTKWTLSENNGLEVMYFKYHMISQENHLFTGLVLRNILYIAFVNVLFK